MDFPHHHDRCPSNHWNRGDDICEDCGLNLNEAPQNTPTELLRLTDVPLMLADWQSDGSKPARPVRATLSVELYRIDLRLSDGRSVWIELEDGKLRIHAYAAQHDDPVNLDVLAEGFDLSADDLPPEAGKAFERSFRFPANHEKECV